MDTLLLKRNDVVPPKDRHWKESRFNLALFQIAALLVCFLILRAALFRHFRPDSPVSATEALKTFLIGFHLDIFAALALTLPLILWLSIVPDRWFGSGWHKFLLRAGFFFFWAVGTFLLFAEYYFFEEFKSRFNTVAVDYLLYPHEVFINIWDTYPVATIVALCSVAGVVFLLLANWLFRPAWSAPVAGRSRLLAVAGALAMAVALGFTVTIKETRFSNERMLNEIANNGQLAFFTAAWTRNLDYPAFYRTLPPAEAHERTRWLLTEPGSSFVEPANSIQRQVAGSLDRPKRNVVILLEESLGSEFWGCLGRKESLTPWLDRLANEEGLLFTNIYASGNRTVRGFEGVLSSFPPLPGDSIVKRDHSQNVETIARVLKRDGYSTVFLYGGRGIFDGMRSFAVNNGYDRFVEQKHFENPHFATIWGVCNEDLYDRAIDEFRAMSATGHPFFATVLSVSNHKPFTYPKGRITENPDERKRENAVKYTDYALGRFFSMAKKEAFYENTIFVVVADHGARVYGSQSIPIHSYEIPLLVIGPAVVKSPARFPQLGCSLDVVPTVLGLLGRPYSTLFFGRDLLRSPAEGGRALLNHNRDIGMFRDNRLVVLGINKTVEFYRGNPKTENMRRVSQPDATDLELEKDATALFQEADDLYTHEGYRVQPPPQTAGR